MASLIIHNARVESDSGRALRISQHNGNRVVFGWVPLSVIADADKLAALAGSMTMVSITVPKWKADELQAAGFLGEAVADVKVAPVVTDAVEEEGVYVVNNTVVKVKKSRAGFLYASRLKEIGGERLTEADTVVNFEYEFVSGLIHQVRASMKMTKEQAIFYGIRYGRCLRCGRKLKAAKSVEAAIGPVCIRWYGA